MIARGEIFIKRQSREQGKGIALRMRACKGL
jgi:hypothetical protein